MQQWSEQAEKLFQYRQTPGTIKTSSKGRKEKQGGEGDEQQAEANTVIKCTQDIVAGEAGETTSVHNVSWQGKICTA